VTLAATREELEAVLGSARFNSYFRFRVGVVAAGECTIEVDFHEDFERPGGVVSGPVFMAAADAATWLAVLTRRGTKELWVTADFGTQFLRAARAERFACRARILKLGRRIAYGVAECVRPDGTVLTHHTVTYARADRDA
jgi:acyl-coenzyme A thioesterase PaaI-like protein